MDVIDRKAAMALVERLRVHHVAAGVHGFACAELAGRTAEALGLDTEAVVRCEVGAMVHDIGMLEVEPLVLGRFGIPSDADWNLLTMHPAIGERIVRSFPGLAGVAPIVRAHHERMDGSGYPDRLRGTAIPIEARVICVVDAFDAMTTPAPHRRDFSAAEAIDELLGNCGTQFDGDVVEAFTAVNGRRARRLRLVASA